MLETLKIVGAILGVIAFFWKLWEGFKRYLHIELKVDVDSSNSITAKTVVENKGGLSKKIENALLLVGPESEDPIETFNQLSKSGGIGTTVKTTNEIAETKVLKAIYDLNGRALIPLDFFYLENIAIGDERLSYRKPIKVEGFEGGQPYSVRFFLYDKGRLHRSTHDSFEIK